MGDISKNFDRSEFACKCGCGQDTVDVELVDVLQRLRDHVNKPIGISSANRCPSHNISVGGSPKSQHLVSKAADLQLSGLDPEEVADLLEQWFPSKYGIGRYNSFTHIDVRGGRSRWDKR